MNIALITIGNELLSGFTVNTNAAWVGNHVLEYGGNIVWHETIGDSKDEIHDALNHVPENVGTVIITGGLGPTHDDVTAHAIYEFVDDTPVFDEEYWNFLQEKMSKRNLKIPKINRNQAMKPQKGKIIANPVGSARGLHFDINNKNLFAVPGVPREMKAMMNTYILPWISDHSSDNLTIHTIRTTGIMESGLAEKMSFVINNLDKTVKIAFLPRFTGVDIRISSIDKTAVDEKKDEIQATISKYIYGKDNQSLEDIIGQLLIEKRLSIAVAESCTGGLVCHRMTNISGSSDYFLGGIVSYSNDVKEKNLGVSNKILRMFGAVSAETAIEMAKNVRSKLGSDLGLSLTGIAGPKGGTDEKPVGLTYVALASENDTIVKEFRFLTDRILNKNASSQVALNMVRLYLLNE
ncbi:MAG TPA: CinA family nicotinamide mononucleotide deamidase-related protein [Candidatus Marinimicrobia bacterium]|jgi:nicotinamide-nucleotide amidase|nr:CinA family nicotinamide mononucleotide deamidase-related protein [Candidatus Neomarinimicrobiota bacterium]HJM69798.1 CinA family nicotinamide mononucleotide deamidase-related protein [Candidatus Neomarinimicrobiota bacterium]|tara:strand:- start:2080 stop:3300 length:1221 start_codon:yes stop_codon:yes gene_type:complete